MRIETKEVKIYNYDDLLLPENIELKNKVIEAWRASILEDTAWQNRTIEDLTEYYLHDMGFEDCKIYYSGFYSQGDGACFDCTSFNIEKLLNETSLIDKEKKRILKIKDYFFIRIYTTNYSYSHENCRKLEVYKDFTKACPCVEKLLDKLEFQLENLRKTASRHIYKAIESAWEHENEEATIMGILHSNGYEFTEDGTIY